VTFSATITVDLPVKVTFRWERSDGAVGPTETVAINGRTSEVKSYTTSTSWELRHPPGQSFRATQRLHVLAPNEMTSNDAEVVINCQ
jgi:hypothetical protein